MSNGNSDKSEGNERQTRPSATSASDAEWRFISQGRPAGRKGTVLRKHFCAKREDLPKLVPVAIAHTFLPTDTLEGPYGEEQLYEAKLTVDFAWKPREAPVFSWTEKYGEILATERDEAHHSNKQAMRSWLHDNYRKDWRDTWLGQWL